MNSKSILRRWPSLRDVASDVGVRERSVRMWEWRDAIPPRHWAALLAAARRRRLGLTLQELATSACATAEHRARRRAAAARARSAPSTPEPAASDPAEPAAA